ncbi:MAG: polysaccharide deacetylase family protein [Coriobacteriia bacterium]|jgi:peptidoglycan/xylan/chitin deacetylase (PgdA/CDA1 family)|nr:polysaccharide deacetylase family protein [Coriobacteriia bacterium]
MMRALRRTVVFGIAVMLLLPPVSTASGTLSTSHPHIALTFDDAPEDVRSPLDILVDKGAKASFFLIGQSAEQKPDEAMAIALAGMLVWNRSYDHGRLT